MPTKTTSPIRPRSPGSLVVMLLALACTACTTPPSDSMVERPLEAAAEHASETPPSVQGQVSQNFIADDAAEADAWVVALSADLSAGAAEAGEAIRRGAELAMTEINTSGGVLGRPLRLVLSDHHGNPSRAVDHLPQLAAIDDLVAIIGGLHSPVALAELPFIHEHEIPFLVAWAAATPIISNTYQPNFAFRVSVRDEYAATVFREHGRQRGLTKPGLLLEQTPWGRSNLKAITQALGTTDLPVQWFGWGTKDFSNQIQQLRVNDIDHVIMVCNPSEGHHITRTIAELPTDQKLPIVSHWGIIGAGHRFYSGIADYLHHGVDLSFLQTFSFYQPPRPELANKLLANYCHHYCTPEPGQKPDPNCAPSAPGTAHAYELVHMLATAMHQAGSAQGPAIRKALEQLTDYDGLLKKYDRPFSPDHHDALTPSDLIMCRYAQDGSIQPWAPAK